MTIVAARRYEHGQPLPQPLAIDGTPGTALPAHSFDWVGLSEPSAAEMDLVRRQFGLHPLAVEDALNPTQLPKVEVYGRTLFVIVRTAALGAGEVITYGQTAVFLGPDYVVSVRYGSDRSHHDLRRTLEANSERLTEGPDYVLHAILDFVVDGYLPIMERLEVAMQEMEESAIDVFPSPDTIRRIFRLRRQLRRFQRIIGPMEEVCERLATTDLPSVDPAARVWFRDVLDHMRRALTRLTGLKETLASIVETASLLEQHRQGDMTRQLAAWAAILAVPTAIAGIYGMNFAFMPELQWKYGYFVVVGAMLLICTGLWLRFRKLGWV